MRKFLFQSLLSFLFLTVSSQTISSQVVISQLYGGAGCGTAGCSTYKNDFIELFNRSASPVSLNGWSVQYASATGTTWQVTALSNVTLQPGQYYLVAESFNANGVTTLPTPDVTGAIAMSATVGKVALVNSTIALSGACPTGAAIIDFIGYGTTANCSETALAPAPATTTADIRGAGGCTDANNNSTDFTTGTPNPRNTSTAFNVCGGGPVTTVSVAAGTNAAEPATNGTFTINLSSPAPAGGITVTYTLSGTATLNTDYSDALAGTITIAEASSTGTITLTPIDDPDFEGTETIGITLNTATSPYTITTGTASINLTDNDAPPSVTVVAGVNAAEPSANGTFTINLSVAAPAGGVTVNYTLSGSALLNTDYTDAQSGSISILQGQSSGTVTLNASDDPDIEGNETIIITLNNASNGYVVGVPASANISLLDNDNPPIVINEVYGGGGNGGSLYKNDFIELYNNSNASVSLAGWSVQYNSSAGTGNWQVTNLSGNIPAHGYYLVQEAAGGAGTANLPTPDATGTIAMAAGAGKVALVNNTAALAGQNPSSVAIVDKVAYGSVTGGGFEGSGSAPAPSNTASIQRTPTGFDSNNNATDFTVITPPAPKNSVTDVTPPTLSTLSPATTSANVPDAFTAMLTFNENIEKLTGNIVLKKLIDNSVVQTIDVASSAVTVGGANVSFLVQGLAFNTSYYFEVDNGAFRDLSENIFAGFSGSGTWSFTTRSQPTGTIGSTYSFNTCNGFPDEFSFYSEAGPQLWGCTSFGRNAADLPLGSAPFGVQINGFSGTNIPNVDWLISPSFDLTGTVYPLLSFWSRTAFNGLPLQLKVSTDYTSGDPAAATWIDLNGKFPGQTSNKWTLSDNINLSAFKQSNVHFAFIYTSSDDDGARWTLDDLSITNSLVAPPPSLTLGTNDVQFPYVASGSFADKTFTFIGNDLTGDVTLSSTGVFLLSKDGISFSSSIQYTLAEANNVNETVYVRFSPTQNDQNYTGTATLSTSGLTGIVNLKGTSIDPATTLEVVNWNMEWFGSTSLGPTNDNLQEQNAETILTTIGADIYGLVEVVDEARLANIVSHMPGYSYVICNYGSHTNPFESGAGSLSEAQKEAFVYKTSLFSNISTTALVTNGVNTAADLSNPAYNYFSSGRYPFMMTADVTLNGITKKTRFVLLHAKANTSPTAISYARRKAGSDTLKYTLNNLYAGDNIIILGDINDDLDSTITDGINPKITSYYAFTHDTVTTFSSPTLTELSLTGKKSTVSYNDVIDHVILSNEIKPYFMTGSANVLTDVAGLISNYGSTTSDHYPVFTRYQFCKLTCPDPIVVSNDPGQCGAVVNFNVASTMICGTVTAIPASGSFFSKGITTVNVTAGTGETCSFTVTVNDTEKPVITPPANVSVSTDAGICNATNVSLGNATATDNCTGTIVITNDAPSAFLKGETTVTWTATDASGNTSTATQTVTVTDNEKPVITSCPTVSPLCYSISGSYTIPAITATDNCSTVTYGYVITGATSRSGSTSNASGTFSPGSSTITWTVTDGSGNTQTCQTNVIVNSNIIVTIPDAFALSSGTLANTVYIGYAPASTLTLVTQVSGGNPGYTYLWSTGATTSSINVSPVVNTVYSVTITDQYGCHGMANKSVSVKDIRGGKKLDKVTICHSQPGSSFTVTVSSSEVPIHLSHGDMLGACTPPSKTVTKNNTEEILLIDKIQLSAIPNPSANSFAITVKGGSDEKVSLRVVDIFGRTVEQKIVQSNQTLKIGARYRTGIYLVEAVQGKEKSVLRLIKIND
jgi:hypothetical protein